MSWTMIPQQMLSGAFGIFNFSIATREDLEEIDGGGAMVMVSDQDFEGVVYVTFSVLPFRLIEIINSG
jgi:hypothetical protein